MKKITLKREDLTLEDKVLFFFEKTITPFGNGAKIDAPKEFLGKKVYVLIRKD